MLDPQILKNELDVFKNNIKRRGINVDVDLLISGHFHHYFCQPRGGRWFMQCPSLDGGSGWYTDTTGDHSGPGTLVFLISAEKKEYFWEYPKIIE